MWSTHFDFELKIKIFSILTLEKKSLVFFEQNCPLFVFQSVVSYMTLVSSTPRSYVNLCVLHEQMCCLCPGLRDE